MRLGLGLGVNKGRKSGFVQDAAITALLDQATTDGNTAFSGNVLTASNTLVTDLKSAGIWDKLDLFYVFATNGDEAFARYNWKAPSTFQCSVVDTPAFTTLEGFTGDGVSSYLNTNYNLQSDSVNYTQNSASFGFYTRTNNNTPGEMGSNGSTLNFLHVRQNTTSTLRVNSNTNTNFATTDVDGFWQANRDGASSTSAYYNGIEVTSSAAASFSPLVNANMNILKSYSLFTTKQISIAFVGASLVSEASDFYTAVQDYMTSIGSQV